MKTEALPNSTYTPPLIQIGNDARATTLYKKHKKYTRIMEEVQKYLVLYDKFSKDFKDKYKKQNAWSPEEAGKDRN